MKQKIRNFLQNNRWIKWIPNALTLCNSLCGFAAILITIQAYKQGGDAAAQAKVFGWAAGMILFAMVFDAFDGYTARLLNAASMHGIQMDSLSDMVTFGVAPATLVAVMAHNVRNADIQKLFIPICICCAIYLGCAALRLATYNVHAILEKKSDDKFSGLPSPGAAAAICIVVIYMAFIGVRMSVLISYLPYYAAVLGLLMVSNVPYLHFAKWLISVKRNRFRMWLLIAVIIIWIITGAAFCNPFLWPLIVVTFYVVWGPVAFIAVKLGLIRPKHPIIRESSQITEEDIRK